MKCAIRKRNTSFLVFNFWDLKCVPIDSALNSASSKNTKNSNQTWKSRLIFFWNALSCKTGKCWNLNCFLQEVDEESFWWIKTLNFGPHPLTCNPALFRAKKSVNGAKSNLIFPEEGRGDRVLILPHLHIPMAKSFSE